MLQLLSLVLLTVCSRTNCELFTAISDMEHLLETHKSVIDDLEQYIELEEASLRVLKGYIHHYKREHYKAMKNISNYLGNHLNVFTLIKRLTIDLDTIDYRIKIVTEYIKNITLKREGMKYPAEEDLVGAALAFTRLKKTYRLQVDELAEGMIHGVIYSLPMTASDCYALGRLLYFEKEFDSAIEWMMIALKKLRESDSKYSFTEVNILDFIRCSHRSLGSNTTALECTKRLLEIDPNQMQHKQNCLLKFSTSNEKEEAQKEMDKNVVAQDTSLSYRVLAHNTSDSNEEHLKRDDRHTFLCRGEMEIAPKISKRLKCWYLTENHLFLKYAPIKVEQMYIHPNIFILHEVMSDDEIDGIKKMAKPRLQRAKVFDSTSGRALTADYRISKSAWLRDEEAELVARVSRRVSHMTGLDMRSAEELQVVNYGIGGHYEPHYDFARKRENVFSKVHGNRIATVLFYMSDVAQGGATVFTELGLSLFPIKGAAAFWLNLHPSGEGDAATRHAACPVLRGSKWVATKWLHQGGQELIRPCTLQYQPEGMVRPLRPHPKTAQV